MHDLFREHLADTLGAIAIIVGIGGIWAAYYFYRKSIRAKKPTFAMRTFPLIVRTESMLKKLRVTYNGAPVDNISVTTVWFWNAGNDGIGANDVVAPIRIEAVNEVRIRDAELLRLVDSKNNIDIHMDAEGTYAEITFGYLNPNQGAEFQIVHTGTANTDLRPTGTILGVEGLSAESPDIMTSSSKLSMVRILIALGGFLFAGSIVNIVGTIVVGGKLSDSRFISFLIIAFITLLGTVALSLLDRRSSRPGRRDFAANLVGHVGSTPPGVTDVAQPMRTGSPPGTPDP